MTKKQNNLYVHTVSIPNQLYDRCCVFLPDPNGDNPYCMFTTLSEMIRTVINKHITDKKVSYYDSEPHKRVNSHAIGLVEQQERWMKRVFVDENGRCIGFSVTVRKYLDEYLKELEQQFFPCGKEEASPDVIPQAILMHCKKVGEKWIWSN